MTSTLLQQQHAPSPTITKTKTTKTIPAKVKVTSRETRATTTTTTTATATMAWTNEKLRFSCIDNIGLKQLWKLIALDTANSNNNNNNSNKRNNKNNNSKEHNNIIFEAEQQQQQQQQQHHEHIIGTNNQNNNNNNNNNNNERINFENCDNLTQYLTNREILPPSHMSLLKFLAINALELSAPASPVFLEQQQQQQQQTYENTKPQGWMQLSGHPESIVPTTSGIVRKRIASVADSEVLAYQAISLETQTAQIVPTYYGTRMLHGENFIELQDLLDGFKDPCVMDIKMGCRTFLETEVSNRTLRADLYQKMIAVDPLAPTAEEHATQSITKLRYMLFREAMSSSHTKGFRIEALRLRGRAPLKDLKTCRTNEQILQTIEQFLATRKSVQKDLIKRLKHMRLVMEQSEFFARHEIVGSSIFIVYDNEKVGAWLIDFAKSRELPAELLVNHRADWVPGNREEGLLKGMDELIHAFEEINARSSNSARKCLHI